MIPDETVSYIEENYEVTGEHLFSKSPECLVFRHGDNSKWFAVIMQVPKKALGLCGEGEIFVLDVKLDPVMVSFFRTREGFLPAWHMNKDHWLTLRLDGTLPLHEITPLVDESYSLTASRKRKIKKARGPRDWLIPANPIYYDVVAAFEKEAVIDWKQSTDVRPGDTIYMYVAKPVASLLYRCTALETGIPYAGHREDLSIRMLMKIRREFVYEPGAFSFDVLKTYGVFAVRGPRSLPNSLKNALDSYEKRGEKRE